MEIGPGRFGMHRILMAAAALSLALAGCSSGTSGNYADPSDSDPSDSSDPGVTVSASGSVGPSPSSSSSTSYENQTTYTWKVENRTGTVSGVALVVQTPSAEEDVMTANATKFLVLNLTVTGGELVMTAVPPGCDDAAACGESTTSSGGSAQIKVAAPDEGSWNVMLEAATMAGPVDADYELEIAQNVLNATASG